MPVITPKHYFRPLKRPASLGRCFITASRQRVEKCTLGTLKWIYNVLYYSSEASENFWVSKKSIGVDRRMISASFKTSQGWIKPHLPTYLPTYLPVCMHAYPLFVQFSSVGFISVISFTFFVKGALFWGEGGPPVLKQPARHLPRLGRGFVSPPVCPTSPAFSSAYGGASGDQFRDCWCQMISYISHLTNISNEWKDESTE